MSARLSCGIYLNTTAELGNLKHCKRGTFLFIYYLTVVGILMCRRFLGGLCDSNWKMRNVYEVLAGNIF